MSPKIVYESNIITNISCFDHNSHLESTSTSNIRHHSTDSTHCPYTYWGTCSAPMCQFIISCHKVVMIGSTLEHSLEHEIFKKLDPCQYQGWKNSKLLLDSRLHILDCKKGEKSEKCIFGPIFGLPVPKEGIFLCKIKSFYNKIGLRFQISLQISE